MRTEPLGELLFHARQAASDAAELGAALREARRATRRACEGRRMGGRLVKWGILLALSPEPLVSDIAGGALVLLGLLLRAGDRAGLADVTSEARRLLAELDAIAHGLRGA